MLSHTKALSPLPAGLREPLLQEYRQIVQNYMERKWLPSELSGGRFCEITFTILDGYAKQQFAQVPAKPNNFKDACAQLETKVGVPRSFQILIPRMLPVLYEIRNNRGVGHVGGDIDPNHMDATAVVGMVNWILAELVRVFHQLTVDEAQKVVDLLVERRISVVWQVGDIKRVLNPSLKLKDQVLLLICSSPTSILADDLFNWTGYRDRAYFGRLLRNLHKKRMVELAADEKTVEILPPGAKYVEEILMPALT